MPNFDFTDVFSNGMSEQGQNQASGLVGIASNLRTGDNPAYALSGFIQSYPNFINPDKLGITTLTATVTSASTTITVDSTASIVVGQICSGTGIPAGTYVTSITDATNFVISNAATAAGTSVNLYNPIVPIVMINMYIGLANNCIKQSRWHSYWVMAMGWFVAHFLTLYLQSVTMPNGTAAQVINAGLAHGLNSNKSVGDVSAGYDYNLIGQDLNGWAQWKATTFGLQLATIGKLVGKGGSYIW